MSGKTNNFSIIIPFKSGKKYLLDCLHSVLAQDYPHFNILILADNTSNIDDSLDAVHAIQNSKISVHVSNQNLDILQNWGRIKDLAKNEYMTILGYDDLLEKTFLSTINELINQNPEASLYHTHFNYINSKSEFIKICQPLPTRLNLSEYLEHALNESIDIMATGYVFKSSDYDAIGGMPTQYPNLIYADLQLWLALTKKSYLAVDNSVQFSFRIHASTTKTSKDKVLLDAFLVFLDYLNQLKNESSALASIIEENGKKFTESTTKAIAHRLLRTPKAIRKGLTIDEMITKIDEKSKLLGIDYAPLQINSIRMAKLIEAVPLFNNLFLLFKKVYKKPVL
jgi:glycosyltransferase involved in cell wall biosynthesis